MEVHHVGGDLLLLTEFKTSPRTTYHPVKGREEGSKQESWLVRWLSRH